MLEGIVDFVLFILNEVFLGSLKYIGASFKKIYKKKEFKEILKEDWNTILGLVIVFILIVLIIYFIE